VTILRAFRSFVLLASSASTAEFTDKAVSITVWEREESGAAAGVRGKEEKMMKLTYAPYRPRAAACLLPCDRRKKNRGISASDNSNSDEDASGTPVTLQKLAILRDPAS
jgi:hypothetical protein